MKLPPLPKVVSPRAKRALFSRVAVVGDKQLIADLHVSVDVQEAFVEALAVGGFAIRHTRVVKPRAHPVNDLKLSSTLVADARVCVPTDNLWKAFPRPTSAHG